MLYSNGQTHEPTTEGLVAMLYDCEVGWVPEAPGPNSTYWKQIKREKTKDGPPIKMEPIGTKRPGPSSLQAFGSKRSSSWRLLETLNAQFDLPWVVFGDFNKITHIEEKCGGAERDANQMEAF